MGTRRGQQGLAPEADEEVGGAVSSLNSPPSWSLRKRYNHWVLVHAVFAVGLLISGLVRYDHCCAAWLSLR